MTTQTAEPRANRDPVISELFQVKQLCAIKTVRKLRDAKQRAAGIKQTLQISKILTKYLYSPVTSLRQLVSELATLFSSTTKND